MKEWLAAVVYGALGLLAATSPPHGSSDEPPGDGHATVVEALRRYETERRAATDFAALPPSNETQGADPYRILPAPGTEGFIGLLRGRNALVLLDPDLREIHRVSVTAFPGGMATDGERVLVGGELSPTVEEWRLAGRRWDATAWLQYMAYGFVRDLALGPHGLVYVIDAVDGDLRLLEVPPPVESQLDAEETVSLPRGAFRLLRVGGNLVVNCLLDHCLLVLPLDEDGLPRPGIARRIQHDGPFWCFHAVPDGDGLLIAAGGVENRPLDRSGGFFGNIDSFVYVYRVPAAGDPVRLAEVNVSELGVVTPKGIHVETVAAGTRVTVAGAGGFALATLTWPGELRGEPRTRVRPLPAGSADLLPVDGGWVLPNPLLDAWVRVDADTFHVIEVPSLPRRDPLERLGEALFTTVLMAPFNTSDGARSRFTCETCHFEGTFDGRVHWTGRDSVFASTKPLRGLFNNRPHFSRALDPDMATMVHNEFRVAGAASGTDPWFSLRPGDYPGLEFLGRLPEVVSPDTLRLSLMRYLMGLTPRSNPLAATNLDPVARERAMGRGAIVFRDRCAGCHRPRLVADDPGTEIPFAEWERFVASPEGALVWGSEEIHRTGVKPYVREDGARVPSLRRVAFKAPYFTNGSARTLGEVLDRARWVGGTFFHDGAPPGAPAERLSEWERTCLLAFLRLL